MKRSSSDGTLRPSRSRRRSISCAMACETSSARSVWIAVLPGRQVGDGGFIVGAVGAGLCERRGEPAIADVLLYYFRLTLVVEAPAMKATR